jgi:hypothetical protein
MNELQHCVVTPDDATIRARSDASTEAFDYRLSYIYISLDVFDSLLVHDERMDRSSRYTASAIGLN